MQFLTGKDNIIFRAKSCGTILHNTDVTTLSVNNPCCCPAEYFCVAYSRTMASSDLFICLSVHESQSRGLMSQRVL